MSAIQVDFDPVLSLPAPAQDLHKIIFEDNKDQVLRQRIPGFVA
jgi:hypothetical protein